MLCGTMKSIRGEYDTDEEIATFEHSLGSMEYETCLGIMEYSLEILNIILSIKTQIISM